MVESKAKSIFLTTDDMHTNVADIYEALMDEENTEAVKLIDSLSRKLKDLKESITKKEE